MQFIPTKEYKEISLQEGLNQLQLGRIKILNILIITLIVGIIIFALIQLSVDISTALFGIEDINTKNLNIIHNIYRKAKDNVIFFNKFYNR